MKKIFIIVWVSLGPIFALAQNIGIGTNSPSLGRLVVRGTVGAVSALFGDNTTGVAIENSFPGIGLNSYYSGNRKLIANGYGGLFGLDPTNGAMYILSSAASGLAGANTAMDYRLYIAGGTGNVSINSTNTSFGKFSVFDNSNQSNSYGLVTAIANPSTPAPLQAAVRGEMNTSSNGGVGVYGYHNASGTGVSGYAITGFGVEGNCGVSGLAGVYGSGSSRGVWGQNDNGAGYGVYGQGGIGVFGRANSITGIGVDCFDGNQGASALALRTTGLSQFNGNVSIIGTLSKSAGTFKIDHPLDPENKFLIHSFVESPDMMNIYNGDIITDGNGMAIVQLPVYFESANIDFKYQLTIIGKEFAQALVYEEIKNNRFTIKTNLPHIKVSWMVTGVRNDPYAVKNRIVPELEKNAAEKGKYLIPALYQQGKEKAIHYRPDHE